MVWILQRYEEMLFARWIRLDKCIDLCQLFTEGVPSIQIHKLTLLIWRDCIAPIVIFKLQYVLKLQQHKTSRAEWYPRSGLPSSPSRESILIRNLSYPSKHSGTKHDIRTRRMINYQRIRKPHLWRFKKMVLLDVICWPHYLCLVCMLGPFHGGFLLVPDL